MLSKAAFTLLFMAACGAGSEIHQIHQQRLGALTCSLCHVPAARGSVMLKPPGEEQCKVCHSGKVVLPVVRTRAILKEFSHNDHVDTKGRHDGVSGLRSDCSFCHKSRTGEVIVPTHEQCASCHSKPGIRPRLSASIATSECTGCHAPLGTPVQNAALANFHDIRFSHATHREDCMACHRNVLRSETITTIALPLMADCVACHRTSECKTCHVDQASHVANVKPSFHTESFRTHHEAEASAPDAKCFACHQNVRPSAQAKDQCVECHQVMKPVSHTARWKNDIHGQFAAMDRTSCSVCHTADYCSRCHNELPRSHVPLPLFKAGGHAHLAMLDQRSCLTCHTFQNTCAACHARQLR